MISNNNVLLDTSLIRYYLYGTKDEQKRFYSVFEKMDAIGYSYKISDLTMYELFVFFDNKREESNDEFVRFSEFIKSKHVGLSFTDDELKELFFKLDKNENYEKIKEILYNRFSESLSTELAELLRFVAICLAWKMHEKDEKVNPNNYCELVINIQTEEIFVYYKAFCKNEILNSLLKKHKKIESIIDGLFKSIILQVVAFLYSNDDKSNYDNLLDRLKTWNNKGSYVNLIKIINKKSTIDINRFIGEVKIEKNQALFLKNQIDLIINSYRKVKLNDLVDFINFDRSIRHNCSFYATADKCFFSNMTKIFMSEDDVISYLQKSKEKCLQFGIINED